MEEVKQGGIEGIVYSEFHKKIGPKIFFQYPAGLLSNEVFDSISDFVIPKNELCHRVIVIRIEEEMKRRFIGYSVYITHKKYSRNALLYNIGFVLSNKLPLEAVELYRPVVCKIAETLRIIEEESEYIYNDAKKQTLFELFPRIVNDLNQYSYCSIPIDDMNAFNLLLKKKKKITNIDINLSHIPIPILSPFWDEENEVDECGNRLDKGMLKVISIIRNLESKMNARSNMITIDHNSTSISDDAESNLTLRGISKLHNIHPYVVKSTAQYLISRSLISLIPPFDYKDTYMVTPKLYKLSTNLEVQRQCVEYVKIDNVIDVVISKTKTKTSTTQSSTLEQLVDSPCDDDDGDDGGGGANDDDDSNNNNDDDDAPPLNSPSFSLIFSFYCKLQGDKDYYSYLQENNLSAHHIHECRFIIFGLVNQFIHSLTSQMTS